MEKCGVADHINMGIVLNKFPQPLHGKLFCLRLAHVKGDLLFKVCPSVCHGIVHMYRIPHDVCQEADRIVVEFFCSMNSHISGLFAVIPLVCRHHFSGGTVNDFPPACDVVMGIYLQHIRI